MICLRRRDEILGVLIGEQVIVFENRKWGLEKGWESMDVEYEFRYV